MRSGLKLICHMIDTDFQEQMSSFPPSLPIFGKLETFAPILDPSKSNDTTTHAPAFCTVKVRLRFHSDS